MGENRGNSFPLDPEPVHVKPFDQLVSDRSVDVEPCDEGIVNAFQERVIDHPRGSWADSPTLPCARMRFRNDGRPSGTAHRMRGTPSRSRRIQPPVIQRRVGILPGLVIFDRELLVLIRQCGEQPGVAPLLDRRGEPVAVKLQEAGIAPERS